MLNVFYLKKEKPSTPSPVTWETKARRRKYNPAMKTNPMLRKKKPAPFKRGRLFNHSTFSDRTGSASDARTACTATVARASPREPPPARANSPHETVMRSA